MAAYLRLPYLGKRWGLSGLANRLGVLRWFGKRIAKAEELVETVPKRFLRDKVEGLALKPASVEHRVAYFVGCGLNYALPEAAEASIGVLTKHNCQVDILDNCCCGLPAHVYGDAEAARSLAEKNLAVLADTEADHIVTDCATCASFLRDYPKLFPEGSEPHETAVQAVEKVCEFSELLSVLGVQAESRDPVVVTYHDPCHMSRYQTIKEQPRELLKNTPGVAFVELPEADWCCGGAGTYNIMHYDQSMAVLDRKMTNLKFTGASILATSCPACIVQLAYGVRRHKLPVKVLHVSQILAGTPT